MPPKITRSILTSVLLGVSATLFGCGISEDENSRPSICTYGSARDPLLVAVDSTGTVDVCISDDDDADTHTVSAYSENAAVAVVSVEGETLSVTGRAVGSTSVMVTVTDDSGEDNSTDSWEFEVIVVSAPQLVASAQSPLTDVSLQGSVVSLRVVGLPYERRHHTVIFNSVTVSGIDGIRIEPVTPAPVTSIPIHDATTNTEIKFRLSYSLRISYAKDATGRFPARYINNIGNIDGDTTLTFTMDSGAIAGYDGPALAAQIPVSDTDEIQGPWLWMVVPTDPNAGGGVSAEVDSIASASNDTVTETDIATRGVKEGKMFGQFQWTSGSIAYTHGACEEFCVRDLFGGCATLCWWNNVNDTLNNLGFGVGDNLNGHTAYALISLVSSSDQDDAIIGVESSDAIKIWLNGEIVHREDATDLECRSIHVPLASDPTVCTPDSASRTGYSIPVKLNAGDNLLMVKVRQHGDYWGMVVGLAADFTTELPVR